MTSRSTGKLSTIENEVIREIRAMRASPESGLNASLLESAARAAHHFILDSHGNVQLRLATIAREFGAEMRTIERAFFEEYQMTMVACPDRGAARSLQATAEHFPSHENQFSRSAPWLQRGARLQPFLQKAHAPVAEGMEQKRTRENHQGRAEGCARLRGCQSTLEISLGIEGNASLFILSHSASRFLLHLGMRSVRLGPQLD